MAIKARLHLPTGVQAVQVDDLLEWDVVEYKPVSGDVTKLGRVARVSCAVTCARCS